ncbi:MAG: hypothetical protein WBW02_21295 [Candidatus Sulfotelmatobacter sp.]
MPGTRTHASAIVNFFSLTRVIKYTMHSMRMNTGYSTVRIAQILGVNEEVVRSLLEVGGTPKPEEASNIGVERIRQRKHRFHCLCGAALVTSQKTVTCYSCGKTMGIRRVKHTHWRIAPRRGVQSLLQLAIYTALSVLLLGYLYQLTLS